MENDGVLFVPGIQSSTDTNLGFPSNKNLATYILLVLSIVVSNISLIGYPFLIFANEAKAANK